MYKAAILGTGIIARKMAYTLNEMEGVRLYAVASRTAEKAEAFANEFGAEKAYGSYEEMAKDSGIDLVYVATPHSLHAENALLCLEHGRNVLVEKPFAVNARQAEEVFAKAREKGLFAGEAMWARFKPIQKTLQKLIKEDRIIGEVTCVTANTGGQLTHVPRLVEPELAGGALLDVGIYPLNFASMMIDSEIERIDSHAVLTDKGVDAQNGFVITYKDGKMAILGSSMVSEMNSLGVVYGTDGRIEADYILDIGKITVIKGDWRQEYPSPRQISGFEFEVEDALKAIEEGRCESRVMPHNEVIRMMSIMDGLREEWGVKYPFE